MRLQDYKLGSVYDEVIRQYGRGIERSLSEFGFTDEDKTLIILLSGNLPDDLAETILYRFKSKCKNPYNRFIAEGAMIQRNVKEYFFERELPDEKDEEVFRRCIETCFQEGNKGWCDFHLTKLFLGLTFARHWYEERGIKFPAHRRKELKANS